MPFAAFLPAPIARITVAAPLTASPPANTPLRVVCIVTSSAIKHLCLLASKPAVVLKINGFGEVPSDMITISTSRMKSEPAFSTGLLLHEASGSPSSISTHLMPLTQPFSSPKISLGFVKRRKITPSSLA